MVSGWWAAEDWPPRFRLLAIDAQAALLSNERHSLACVAANALSFPHSVRPVFDRIQFPLVRATTTLSVRFCQLYLIAVLRGASGQQARAGEGVRVPVHKAVVRIRGLQGAHRQEGDWVVRAMGIRLLVLH